MHIVFLADPLDTQEAGIHYFCVEVLRHLVKKKEAHNITIIRQKKLKNFPEATEIGIGTIPLLGRYDPIRKFYTIPKKVRALKPDIVVEMAHFGPFGLPKNIKRITVIHDVTPIRFSNCYHFIPALLQRIFLPRILKKAWKVITPSLKTEEDLHNLYPITKGKTVPILNTVSEIFKPTIDPKVMQKHQLIEDYFLHVGTLEPRKNHLQLLKAYEIYHQKTKHPKKLILVGSKGWKSKRIHHALQQHPFTSDIRLLGYVDRHDLPALYTQCEAFILPSIYEGFGLPLLEAMKCGAYCISSNTSSLPEVGGDAVQYFNPYHEDDLAELMLKITPIKRETYRKKAIVRGLEFDWNEYVRQLLLLLTSD